MSRPFGTFLDYFLKICGVLSKDSTPLAKMWTMLSERSFLVDKCARWVKGQMAFELIGGNIMKSGEMRGIIYLEGRSPFGTSLVVGMGRLNFGYGFAGRLSRSYQTGRR